MNHPGAARTLSSFLFFLAIVGLLAWFGCADNSLVSDVPQSSVAPEPGEASLAKAAAARAQLPDDLLDRDGVEGIGTRVGADGASSIVIYVRSEQAAARANLPNRVSGLPVAVVATGPFVARSDETSRARPAPIGFSVGHPDITAGTIGARVKNADGDVFILSNNHVLANVNEAELGDNSLQPGPYDGGVDPGDAIGQLFDFEPISFSETNTMDAAVSLSDASVLDYKTPSDEGYGTPGTTVETAATGMDVQKYGRTTGRTVGEVAEIDVTVDVCYVCANPVCTHCAASARFTDQIGITPGDFSAGGDSGSLIVTDDGQKNPVALLFAGSSSRTLGNPIGPVLDRFNVSIDDGSGGGGTTNDPPSASFTYSCTDLKCDFDGSGSSDADGSIQSYDWDFGDGDTAWGATTSHTYDAGGTYTVTLTVTDDDGAAESESRNVSVSSGGSGGVSLNATGYKVRGLQKADLTWSGAASEDVDVYRNDATIVTTANDGAHTDHIDNRGNGSYTYRVCEAGTSTCSNESTVSFN